MESGIWARKAWGSRLQKSRTATNVCFHLLSQATLRALPDKSPSQSAAHLREKVTEAVMFVKNVYKTACKETWSLSTPLIAADYSGHTGFCRQECQLLLHSRTSGFSAGTFDATSYSMPGWRGSGLLFGRMIVPHLCGRIATLAGGHTSDSHLAIQIVIQV